MKILYITHQYFPYFYTGTELLTDNLSRYQRYLGYETEVWAYNLEGGDINKIQKTLYKGIPVTFFTHHNDDKDKDWKMYRDNPKRKKWFRELLKKSAPDVIHVTHLARMGDIVQAAYELGIPYVTTITDYWLLCPTATLVRENGELCGGTAIDSKCLRYCYKNKKRNMEERWSGVQDFLNKATKVGYAANFVRSMFEKNGIDTSNWINVKHGYNPEVERKRTKDALYKFAFTGTLQPSKGGHLAIQAFRKVSDTKARLVVFGETKHNLDYSNYCRSLAEGDARIEFRGRYDHTKLTKEFEDIDCILVTSNWYEPFPFTLISAVKYGFDIIGSRIGGIPEIIGDSNSNSLFEPGDLDDLKNKMEKKILKGKKVVDRIFYEQTLETEGFKYFQIYNFISGKNL